MMEYMQFLVRFQCHVPYGYESSLSGLSTLWRFIMLVNFDKTELLYLDILATEKLDIVKHRYERDKRIFDTLDIDVHERMVLYESQIKAFTDIHNKIVSAVGSLCLEPTV